MCQTVISASVDNYLPVPSTGNRQLKLSTDWHVASLQMAEADFKRMAKYKVTIGLVAHNLCIEPAVIAAIISRESHVGANLKNGMDAGGKYFGLMQLNKEWHTVKGDWDSAEHITQGTEVLIQMMKSIQTKFPTWTINQQLKDSYLRLPFPKFRCVLSVQIDLSSLQWRLLNFKVGEAEVKLLNLPERLNTVVPRALEGMNEVARYVEDIFYRSTRLYPLPI